MATDEHTPAAAAPAEANAGSPKVKRYSSNRRISTSTNGSAVTEDKAPAAEPVLSLGSRLKRVRERSGMSLREVARQLSVSPSFVSQLENGKSQPSVATLYSFAQLLDVSIDELFAEEDLAPSTANTATRGSKRSSDLHIPAASAVPAALADHAASADHGGTAGGGGARWPREQALAKLSVTHPGERHVLKMDSGVIWERLADNSGTGLDFIEIVYPPHSTSTTDQRMLQHAGSEFGYLLAGEIEITVGFDVLTLRAGDAIGFDSAIPHLLVNRTDEPARGIWCVRHGYV